MTTPLPDIDPALPAIDPAAMTEFNRLLIGQFRACRGRLSGQLADAPVLLLTTVGAKSGRAHTTPLGFSRDGRRYVVAASKAGAPANPDWYRNLLANAAATVETGTETFTAHSTIANGEERIRLFGLLAAQWPMQLDYQQKATRQIPVVILERLSVSR